MEESPKMTIEITLGKLVAAADDQYLGGQPGTESPWHRLLARTYPVRLAYRLKKMNALVRTDLEHYHELHRDAIKAYGQEADGNWSVQPERWVEFMERMTTILAMSVTIDSPPVALADLGAIEISGADLAALDGLIVGEPSQG